MTTASEETKGQKYQPESHTLTIKRQPFRQRQTHDPCLSWTSVAVIKYPGKSNIRGKGFIWLMTPDYMLSLWGDQGIKHLKQLVRSTAKRRENVYVLAPIMRACPSMFSWLTSIHSVQHPAQEMVPLTIMVGLPTSVSPTKKTPHTQAHAPTRLPSYLRLPS